MCSSDLEYRSKPPRTEPRPPSRGQAGSVTDCNSRSGSAAEGSQLALCLGIAVGLAHPRQLHRLGASQEQAPGCEHSKGSKGESSDAGEVGHGLASVVDSYSMKHQAAGPVFTVLHSNNTLHRVAAFVVNLHPQHGGRGRGSLWRHFSYHCAEVSHQ